METTGEVPAALKNRPELRAVETDAWNAFVRLSPKRNMGGMGGVSAIPLSEILLFIDSVILVTDSEEKAEFLILIEHLDNLFMDELSEQMKKETSKSKNSTKATRPRKTL